MPKILNFTLSEYLKKEDEYLTMTEMVENRAREIAADLNVIKAPYVIDHVDINEENGQVMANAIFYNMLDPDDIKSFGFNALWLFTDEHLTQLPSEDLRKRRFEREFEEFVRLKAEKEKK